MWSYKTHDIPMVASNGIDVSSGLFPAALDWAGPTCKEEALRRIQFRRSYWRNKVRQCFMCVALEYQLQKNLDLFHG